MTELDKPAGGTALSFGTHDNIQGISESGLAISQVRGEDGGKVLVSDVNAGNQYGIAAKAAAFNFGSGGCVAWFIHVIQV